MERYSEDLPTLVAQTGPLNGQRWVLQKELTIGREDTCNIVIPSRQVSRLHARITIASQGILLEDCESKNGTHHNGGLIAKPVALQDGDIIQIALAQQFLFMSSDATLPLDTSNLPMMQARSSGNTGIKPKQRLRLDTRSHRVWVLEREIEPALSAAQFQLLELLYEHQGKVVSRIDLINAVWQDDDAIGVSEQALDALVRRLRDRLAAFDPAHSYIITVRGHGVRMDNPPL